MKILNQSLIFCLILFLFVSWGCTKTVEKPKVSLSQFSQQTIVTKGMIDKILSEPDPKKMHELAFIIESSWMVNCYSVGEECNIFNKILNKIINATHAGPISDADNVTIHKMVNELNEAL